MKRFLSAFKFSILSGIFFILGILSDNLATKILLLGLQLIALFFSIRLLNKTERKLKRSIKNLKEILKSMDKLEDELKKLRD